MPKKISYKQKSRKHNSRRTKKYSRKQKGGSDSDSKFGRKGAIRRRKGEPAKSAKTNINATLNTVSSANSNYEEPLPPIPKGIKPKLPIETSLSLYNTVNSNTVNSGSASASLDNSYSNPDNSHYSRLNLQGRHLKPSTKYSTLQRSTPALEEPIYALVNELPYSHLQRKLDTSRQLNPKKSPYSHLKRQPNTSSIKYEYPLNSFPSKTLSLDKYNNMKKKNTDYFNAPLTTIHKSLLYNTPNPNLVAVSAQPPPNNENLPPLPPKKTAKPPQNHHKTTKKT